MSRYLDDRQRYASVISSGLRMLDSEVAVVGERLSMQNAEIRSESYGRQLPKGI